jgi:hypothetical protein
MLPRLLLLPVLLLVPAVSAAQTPSAAPAGEGLKGLRSLTLPGVGSVEALSGALRAQMVPHLPTTLYQASSGWGNTSRVPNGLKWHNLRPRVQHADKNDGTWRKIHVTADNWADTLVFDLRNVQHPDLGRMTFDVFLSFDARIFYEQQNWESGVRLWSGSMRARCRVKLLLNCEASVQLDSGRKIVPDAVLRMGVTGAHLGYDNLVVEHVAGIGGEAAKLLGDATRVSLRRWHPSLERELLAKGDAAIVKAAGTREVRVNLLSLLRRR